MGSVLLGHADPAVVGAVIKAVEAGMSVVDTEDQDRVRNLLLSLLPYDDVAFFKTGTEAVKATVMGYRAITGKRFVVSAGYHGWDALWTYPREPFSLSSEDVFDCFYVVDELEHFLERHSANVCCAVFSPDFVNLSPGVIKRLFSSCHARAIPIVCDDVKYGLRLHAGVSTAQFGLRADCVTVSKALANGFPLAAVAGPEELLQFVRRYRSTLAYESIAFAAARSTLETIVSGELQATIKIAGTTFIDRVTVMLSDMHLPIEIAGIGQVFQFHFLDRELEECFYDLTAHHGLNVYVGDNQTPSAAFEGAVIDEAVEILSQVADKVQSLFPRKLRRIIPSLERWRGAWNQMDGFSDENANANQRIDFIREQINA